MKHAVAATPEQLCCHQSFAFCCRYGFIVQFTVLPFHQEYADSGQYHDTPYILVLTEQTRLASSSWDSGLCPPAPVVLLAHDGSTLQACLAGHFHRLDKAVTSLRNNAIFYLVLMVRRV